MINDLVVSSKKFKSLSLLAFMAFCMLVVYDMASEFSLISNPYLLLKFQMIEIFILSLGTLAFWLLWKSTIREERSKISFEGELQKLRLDRDHWKSTSTKFVQEFQDYIESHFDIWGLTHAEKEIGLFLVKGLSFKEIAKIRDVSEKTIRNQSLCIYSKSGLSGRQELAAYFLEELLKPVKA